MLLVQMLQRVMKWRRLWIKGCFLSLEMVEWLSSPPASQCLNPHESTLAEAWIPPEPSNLCLGSFPLNFSTDHKKQSNKNNTMRHIILKYAFYCLQMLPHQLLVITTLERKQISSITILKDFISFMWFLPDKSSGTAPHCKPLGI